MSVNKTIQPIDNQKGFTLLELLVVVSVLATLAGITAVAMDGYEQDAQEQLVEVEMQRIASAVLRFKEDTGYFPKEGIFAPDSLYGTSSGDEKNEYILVDNFEWLFSSPRLYDTDGDGDVDSDDVTGGQERLSWNANSSRGWNGPYLTNESQNRLSPEDCDLAAGVDVNNSFIGLVDTFERRKAYTNTSTCPIVNVDGSWLGREFAGQPYEYDVGYINASVPGCDGASGCLALLSYGPDSTKGNDDDIVHILRVNP